jgi:hypothetical protein
MQQLILKIDESRYWLLLQFLKTLDYVKIIQPPDVKGVDPSADNLHATGMAGNSAQPEFRSGNQLALLQQQLQKQSHPLLQNISDPVVWQNQQRDEWR